MKITPRKMILFLAAFSVVGSLGVWGLVKLVESDSLWEKRSHDWMDNLIPLAAKEEERGEWRTTETAQATILSFPHRIYIISTQNIEGYQTMILNKSEKAKSMRFLVEKKTEDTYKWRNLLHFLQESQPTVGNAGEQNGITQLCETKNRIYAIQEPIQKEDDIYVVIKEKKQNKIIYGIIGKSP